MDSTVHPPSEKRLSRNDSSSFSEPVIEGMATSRSSRSTARAPAPGETAASERSRGIGRDHRLARMKMKLFAFGALLALPALALLGPAAAPSDDFVLEGGRVVDGTGAPWFTADVAVRDGRVTAIEVQHPETQEQLLSAGDVTLAMQDLAPTSGAPTFSAMSWRIS